MKKLIKQDLIILLSLMAAYHPEAAASIEAEGQKLTMQNTRDYLFLLRDGQCRICPFADVFQPGNADNQFWLNPAVEACAMHLHLIRVPRDSPEGSAVAVSYGTMRATIEKISALPGAERDAEIAAVIHNSLTRTRICTTADFIEWIKGGGEEWR